MMSNSTRILAAVGILAVMGFLLSSLSGFFAARESLREQIQSSTLPLTSDNVYSEIHRDLMKPIFVSFNMAHDTFLRDWVLSGEKNSDRIARFLTEVKSKNGTIASFFVSDRTGKYYYPGGELKTISPHEPRDAWFYRVKNMSSDYEINIDLDMANQDNMTIFINYKVYDFQGGFLGAAGVGLNVNSVGKLIGRYQRIYGSNIFFVDHAGNITLHSPGVSRNITNLSQIPGLAPLQREILSQQQGKFSYTNDAGTTHVHTRFIPEFQWILIVEKDEQQSLNAIWATLRWNLAICLAISLVIILLISRVIHTYQKRMETIAHTDKLTGAWNRHAFPILMEQTLKEATRSRTETTLAIFDLDHFKQVNDRLGHNGGDDVLREFADLVRSRIRRSDLFFRWGGEEFVLVFQNCTEAEAFTNCEEIRAVLDSRPHNHGVHITVSAGISAYIPGESLEQWLSRCDQLLYTAKKAGRNACKTKEVQP